MPLLLWSISIHRLDSEHGVDAALDELVVDVRVDRDDAPPVTATGRALSDGPVRNRGHEDGQVVRLAVLTWVSPCAHSRHAWHV